METNSIKFHTNLLSFSSILFGIFLVIHASGEMTAHLNQCCTIGTKWAIKESHCQNPDQAIKNVPSVWRTLCLSTFSMCCSKELHNQQCIFGRNAAKLGSDCEFEDDPIAAHLNSTFTSTSSTTMYADCCKACQIGLVVSANGLDCSSNNFSYLIGDESYTHCCNEVSEKDNIYHQSNQKSNQNTSDENLFDNETDEDVNDNTFIVAEDGDICGKVSNLCPQICENTRDSYACKCFDGYRLDDNKVTCSPINEYKHPIADSDEELIDNDDEDNDDEDISKRRCGKGFIKDGETNECIDIDECMIGTAKCRTDQYCYNVIGSYNCLNIKSTLCQDGYRFNAETEECEDIDECKEQNPCGDNAKCVNYAGGYECRKIHRLPLTSSNRDKLQVIRNPLSSSSPRPMSYPSNINVDTKCEPGYRYKNNKCIDIDECITDKNACDSNQICTNEQGGYRCDCKSGFKMDPTLNACVDINECQINNHDCLPTQRCDNTYGSYTCIRLQSCGTGYTLNAETGNCDDDDECDLGTHNCPEEYVCRNTIGSFKCDRRRYPPRRLYLRNNTTSTTSTTTTTSTTPTTITTSTTTPPPTTTTTSTSTSTTTTTTTPRPYSPIYSTSIRITTTQRPFYYSHSPYQPYTRQYPYTSFPTSYVSSQTNSRLSAEHNPEPTHRFKLPLETSSCPYGFKRNRYGACVDINECEIPNACGSHQRCINLNGSYKCQNLLSCPGGFRASSDGTTCIDIDECQTGDNNCGSDQTCHNKPGGYICQCPQGHALNGDHCVDINECEYPNHVCPINAICVNTPGSYFCDCKEGFKKRQDNDKTCADIDECEEIPGLCEQKCVNFWGSYRCSCNLGYELNLSDNRTCNDINECEVHKSYKLCMGFCVNTPGSYECTCPPGYELGNDKASCRDIDECAQPNTCTGHNEICTNIRGSYRCNTIHCPYGYQLDPDQKNRCRTVSHMCDGDECYSKPSTYTYNYITLVSNMLIPPQGRTLFTLRGPSWYDNIDFDLKIANIHAPSSIERATEQHFSTNKIHNQVQLNLMRSLEGPQDIELELSMTVFIGGQPRGKSIAVIYIIVSQYSF